MHLIDKQRVVQYIVVVVVYVRLVVDTNRGRHKFVVYATLSPHMHKLKQLNNWGTKIKRI
jgi:hypothetical protein